MKCLDGLSETAVLALAISDEEEDSRIYADFGHSLRDDHPRPRRCSPTWRPKKASIGDS